jgi:hypothetical protein
LACLLAANTATAEGIDAQQILINELRLSPQDANTYWDGISWTVVTLVADGQRVALDGLGAFSPAYASNADGSVRRTLHFDFDLGQALDQPGMKTAFDADVLKALSSFAWLRETGGTVSKRLQGDEWSKLLDIFVFAILRNIDGQSRQPLGLGLGSFYPTLDMDVSVQRDDNERRIVVDLVADDDSPEKFAYQYDLSIEILSKATTLLNREVVNLNRYAKVSGIKTYAVAAAMVATVSKTWTEELAELSSGGTKAQDHNSSRSNKTASILGGGSGDLDEALVVVKAAAAQDHNSSRSNKTASVIGNVGDGGEWGSETLTTRAQDHNSSRSNKTASVANDFYTDLTGRYDGAYTTKAQDHNSSRSNKTASVAADFDPSPELDELFAKRASF